MDFKIKLNENEFEVNINYKKIKRIIIKITKSNQITISSPQNVTKKYIEEIIKNKTDWIIEVSKQLKLKEDSQNKKEGIYYQGEFKKINFLKEKILKKPYIKDSIESIDIYASEFDEIVIKECIENFLKKRASEKIMEIYKKHETNIEKKPFKIKIKDQKSRWGSCSSKGNINMNYRLIMAPNEVLEYVLVHELCHLMHFNHSKEFWKLVEQIIPRYKEHKQWLKDNNHKLEI